jgi:hypothetical protein
MAPALTRLFLLALVLVPPAVVFPAEALLPLRVLYIGHRAGEFTPLLKAHFTNVASIAREQFKPAQAEAFDVVLLDWPQSQVMRRAWLDGSPLGKREEWKKPTVLLGSAGLNLAVAWKLHGGSGCTCLAPVAYGIRKHDIFKSPMTVNVDATTNIPTPPPFIHELKTDTIPVLPLVDNIRSFHTVINDYQRGWASHYYEFADLPEVEVFCGGLNEQTPRSAAFWRQGNLLHFGFEQSPAEMNATGRALLVNGIAYISRFTEDRPIDVSASVFGPDKIALSRSRAQRYFASFPKELPTMFSAETLAASGWPDVTNATAWFESARPWLHPNSAKLLGMDAEAKSLGVRFDSPDFFPKAIAALRDNQTRPGAEILLARYAPEGTGALAGPTAWEKWWQENSPYLFYSELGGYHWYVDPLAKQRGIPTKDLRGPLRADAPQ